MTTFGQVGRVSFVVGAVLAAATLFVSVVVHNSTLTIALGVPALIGLSHGVLWTVLQHRMFGSVGSVRRVATSGRPTIAEVVAVRGTAGKIGADAIAKVELTIDGRQVTRHLRVPFNYAAELRPGKRLPIRVDPAGSRALIVDWERAT